MKPEAIDESDGTLLQGCTGGIRNERRSGRWEWRHLPCHNSYPARRGACWATVHWPPKSHLKDSHFPILVIQFLWTRGGFRDQAICMAVVRTQHARG